MLRSSVENLKLQEVSKKQAKGTSTNEDFVLETTSADEWESDDETVEESIQDDDDMNDIIVESSAPSSSKATKVDTLKKNPIRQISILGERNSGTRWTFE